MIIDFHTHIFPKDICAQREKYFAGEPAFKLLYRSPKSKMVQADEMVRAMDENGVDKSVVFGFPWNSMEISRRHNDFILEATVSYPDRLIGLCCVAPENHESAREVERCLSAGLAGAGELAFYQSGIDERALTNLEFMMQICRQKNVPVLIHTNEPIGHIYPGKSPNTLVQIYRLIKRYSHNIIVLAHWGGGIFFYNLLKKEAKENLANVFFDTAASPFLYDPAIYEVAKKTIGVEKILMGSDYPLIKPARYLKELSTTNLSQKDIELICGGNALNLFSKKSAN
jgi:predicted TIM-barrel fold metal-dependent hydrolase